MPAARSSRAMRRQFHTPSSLGFATRPRKCLRTLAVTTVKRPLTWAPLAPKCLLVVRRPGSYHLRRSRSSGRKAFFDAHPNASFVGWSATSRRYAILASAPRDGTALKVLLHTHEARTCGWRMNSRNEEREDATVASSRASAKLGADSWTAFRNNITAGTSSDGGCDSASDVEGVSSFDTPFEISV